MTFAAAGEALSARSLELRRKRVRPEATSPSDPLLDLLDLAFDASHYAAPVAQHHARCVLHWMRTVRGAPGEGGGAANDTSRRSTLAYGCFTEYD